ncbi:hypothetical protein [Kaarinaea lacus]
MAESILNVLDPALLAILLSIVFVGWLVRLSYRIQFAPPIAAKITAAIAYFILAYYYWGLACGFVDHDTRRALLRIAILILALHEIAYHVYILWLRKKINGAQIDV